MSPSTEYVESTLRRWARERHHPIDRHRTQWLAWQREERRTRIRGWLRWLGDRLVAAGERLRRWGEPPAGTSLPPTRA
jgi:hypothetical protein